MRRMVALAIASLVLPAGAAAVLPARAAWTPAEAGRAVSTVMMHRSTYLADSLRFDACSVRQALGGGEDFTLHIVEPVRGMLDDAVAACPREAGEGRSSVLVDSLRFSDATAHVYLTVLRGELDHREDHTLTRNRSSAAYMPIREVRLWGHGRAYRGTPWAAH